MTYVTKIEANIKTGVLAELGPKTLIVGPNASGKSAIINAIELALSGSASDVAGRAAVAADGLLRELVAPGQPGRAHASLDDGTTGAWVIGAGRAARTGAVAVFPLREVREHLLGNAETAQKWLLRLAGKGDLPTIVESLARQTREARARAKVLREAATSQAGGLPPEPTDGEIEAAKLRGSPKELADAEAALAVAEERLAAADAVVAEITARRDATPAGTPPSLRIGEAMVLLLDEQINAKVTTKCGLCASPLAPGVLDARRVTITQRIADAQKVKARRDALDVETNNAVHARGVAASDAQSALATVNALKSIAKNGAIPVEIVRLQERWAAVRRANAQAEAAEVEAAQHAARANTEKENLDRESAKALTAFVEKVQGFLPPGDVFGLELDPVRFGLRKEGALYCALSGAEWARVTAAVAAAVAAYTPTTFSIVVPEERAFDPDTLTHVLRAFLPVPCQVILASPIAPAVVPDGWTVVRVDGGGFLGGAAGKEHADDCARGLGGACDCAGADEAVDTKASRPLAEAPTTSIPATAPVAPAGEPLKKRRGRPSKADKAAAEAAEAAKAEEATKADAREYDGYNDARQPALFASETAAESGAASGAVPDDSGLHVAERHTTNADMIVYAREHKTATAADLLKMFPGIAYNRAKAAVAAARGDVEEAQEVAAGAYDPSAFD